MVDGSLPACNSLGGQTLHVQANGTPLGDFDLPFGDFQITVPLPPEFQARMLSLKIIASRSFMPGRFSLIAETYLLSPPFLPICAMCWRSCATFEPPRRPIAAICSRSCATLEPPRFPISAM